MIDKLINKDSGHVVICGKTGSGKTTLAFALCRSLKDSGQICLALDENLADWPCMVTDDHDLFYSRVWDYVKNPRHKCKDIYKEKRQPFINLFIDECGEYTLKDWEKLKTFLTRGRQFGIRVFLLSQRYCLMSKTSRLQCSTFIIFKQGKSDVEEIRDLTCSEAFDITGEEFFPNLHFVFKTGNEPAKKLKIIFTKRQKDGFFLSEFS